MTKIILKKWKPNNRQVSKKDGDCSNCKYSLDSLNKDPCKTCEFTGISFTLWEPEE